MNTTTSYKGAPDTAHFLNRVALEYECNPHKLRLLPVLKDFFSYASLQEHLNMFDQFCIAAMQQQYTWKGGNPGNGLFYAERLELLIETAYLMHIHRAGKLYKKAKRKISRISANDFPMYLTSNELLQPLTFVESFFVYATLQRWKKMLNAFTSNALSNGTVADELPPEELLRFVCFIKKLICAAYCIALPGKKNN